MLLKYTFRALRLADNLSSKVKPFPKPRFEFNPKSIESRITDAASEIALVFNEINAAESTKLVLHVGVENISKVTARHLDGLTNDYVLTKIQDKASELNQTCVTLHQ